MDKRRHRAGFYMLPIRVTADDAATHTLEALAAVREFVARKGYREEREYPELIDLGGEG